MQRPNLRPKSKGIQFREQIIIIRETNKQVEASTKPI